MQFNTILVEFDSAFRLKYAERLLPRTRQAIHRLMGCRTEAAGSFKLHCSECDQVIVQPRSCGHRSCPHCQHHETSRWLERQVAKLLPVDYFMVTFTLPFELRSLAWHHQTAVYNSLFDCAASTLKDFGLNPDNLGADLGMTGVLHTHSRRLDYHPHCHFVVPGGGINRRRRQWRKVKGKFLFNECALAKVFRARFIDALNQAGLPIPCGIPKQWVVDCKPVGRGKPALKYLSRYLYRGVISEQAIVSVQDGSVTFRYQDGKTGKPCYRSMSGEDFCWLVLQHVLPKGFRRVRDYGFLHGNAKQQLTLVQLVLHVIVTLSQPLTQPCFQCPQCQSPMTIIGFIRPGWQSG